MSWFGLGPVGSAALVVLAAASFIVIFGWALRKFKRGRQSPEESERLRRLELARQGRTADGMISEYVENTIYFSYTVAGSTYHTSQDLSTLREQLPHEHEFPVGPCSVRFLRNNPANSIVVCEEWSGLRISRAKRA